MSEKKKRLQPTSDIFMRAVCSIGSPSILCEFCGRTHFAPTSDLDWDEGELDELLDREKKEPDKYLADHSVSSILWGYLDGRQIVAGCPCNSGRKYEDFILRHRYVIVDFLQARARKKKEDAAEAEKIAQRIEAALPR